MGTNPSSIKWINDGIQGSVTRSKSPAGPRATNPTTKVGKPRNSNAGVSGAYGGADRSQPTPGQRASVYTRKAANVRRRG